MDGDARERHGLFRYGAFAAARVLPPIDPERFESGNLPPPTARMETSSLLIGSAGTCDLARPSSVVETEVPKNNKVAIHQTLTTFLSLLTRGSVEHMADDPPRSPPLLQFPLKDAARGALTYRAPDLTPPSAAHDPAPTFKRSIWILRLICVGVLLAFIFSLFMI